MNTCPECGAAFVPRYGSQVCCSAQCQKRREKRRERESLKRRNRRPKLSPRLRMLENLRKRDAIAPKPKTEIICSNGIIIERRGTVPAGCHAADFIRHS